MGTRAPNKDCVDVTSKPVVVCVGSAKQDYYVHEGLLTSHSRFFKAALGNDWKEAETRRVSLPEDDPAAFKLYASWLYQRKICSSEENNDHNACTSELRRLTLAYVLGEKLQDVDFKDAIIDAMIARTSTSVDDGKAYYPSPWAVTTLYNNTTDSSPARQLMVDYHASESSVEFLRKNSGLPAEFFRDLALFMVARKGQKIENPETRADKCYYHGHTKEGTPCYTTLESAGGARFGKIGDNLAKPTTTDLQNLGILIPTPKRRI